MKQHKKRKTQLVSNQVEVGCPRWLQKKILKNLRASTHNKINPARAKTAEKLLTGIKHNTEKATSQAQSKTEKTYARSHPNGQLLKPTPNVNPKRQKFMGNMFRKYVNSLRNFMAWKKHSQAAHSQKVKVVAS